MGVHTLRPAGAADAEFLFEVYAQSRTEELAALAWSGPQTEQFLRMQFAARDAHYRSVFPAADSRIVQVQGKDAGRLLVDRQAEAIHLVDIALLARHRGHGVGSRLLGDLQREAADTRCALVLSVATQNRARELYRRLGLAEGEAHGLHVGMRWQPPSVLQAAAHA